MNKKRLEEVMAKRAAMIEKHGWMVDAIFDTEDSKLSHGTGTELHTHGLVESFQHPDIQCILPIDNTVIHQIFVSIVDQIKEGKKFKAGKCYSNILANDLKVRFITAEEGGREVLRLILPDANGKLHKELMGEFYQCQYNGLKENK